MLHIRSLLLLWAQSFSAIRELPLPSRLFLLFTAINVVSWQCIAGQALVLFARAMDMPARLVGLLLSFMPISMLLVVFAVPFVEWFGPRHLLISTWLLRNLMAAGVFLMPWAIDRFGPAAGWYVLLFSTLAFSLIRAVGVGGWFPWLHEIIPKAKLGVYFSIETAMVQIINIILAFGMAQILARGHGLGRFFLIYAIGIGAGLLSILFIRRIPGGAGLPPEAVGDYDPRPTLNRVWQDCDFRNFVVAGVLGAASLMWLGSTLVMYLRDVLGQSDSRIMLLLALGGIGVAVSVRFWGQTADRLGSGPPMIVLLAGHLVLALAWLGLLPGWQTTPFFVVPIFILTTVVSAAFSAVASRGMLCRVRDESRVGYTALWILTVSIANGLPPIVTGWLIDALALNGFRLCFLIAGTSGLVAIGLLFRLPPEDGKLAAYILRPGQPLRNMGRLCRLTFGSYKQGKN